MSRDFDIGDSVACLRYYAGWADKIQGNTIETTKDKISYTVHEPLGVVGQIIPWNFPRTRLRFRFGLTLSNGLIFRAQ